MGVYVYVYICMLTSSFIIIWCITRYDRLYIVWICPPGYFRQQTHSTVWLANSFPGTHLNPLWRKDGVLWYYDNLIGPFTEGWYSSPISYLLHSLRSFLCGFFMDNTTARLYFTRNFITRFVSPDEVVFRQRNVANYFFLLKKFNWTTLLPFLLWTIVRHYSGLPHVRPTPWGPLDVGPPWKGSQEIKSSRQCLPTGESTSYFAAPNKTLVCVGDVGLPPRQGPARPFAAVW